MFNFLKSAKVDIDISPEQSFYKPGDMLRLHVTIKNHKEVQISRARLTLCFQELYLYEYERIIYTGKSQQAERTSQWADNEEVLFEEDFLSDSFLPAHSVNSYIFDINLPDVCAPTCSSGKILKTKWLCDVFLQTRTKNNLRHEIKINVLQACPHPGSAIEFKTSDHPGDVDLSLWLPSKNQNVKQALKGEFRIKPLHDFSASFIKIELTRHETTLSRQPAGQTYEVAHVLINQSDVNYHGAEYNHSHSFILAENVFFKNGEIKIFPFEIPFEPDSPPTLTTSYGAIRWTIKGIIERGATQRSFCSGEEELPVFTTIPLD